ncbi:hypothetical protein LSAT2_004963 [Lamellibrachia satsuma]|nr:hypothetical protein LSAT2_004963 [Lamellibrachia satsuma]
MSLQLSLYRWGPFRPHSTARKLPVLVGWSLGGGQLVEHDGRLQDHNHRLGEVEKHDGRLQSHDRRLGEVQRGILDNTGHFEGLDHRVQGVEGQLVEHDGRLQDHDQRLSEVQRGILDNAGHFEGLDHRVQGAEGDVRDNKEHIEGLDHKVQGLEGLDHRVQGLEGLDHRVQGVEINTLLKPRSTSRPQSSSTEKLCSDFATYFAEKTQGIRVEIQKKLISDK